MNSTVHLPIPELELWKARGYMLRITATKWTCRFKSNIVGGGRLKKGIDGNKQQRYQKNVEAALAFVATHFVKQRVGK